MHTTPTAIIHHCCVRTTIPSPAIAASPKKARPVYSTLFALTRPGR